MLKRISALLLLAATLTGCGSGHGITDRLYRLRPGVSRWVYQFTGTVTLPSGGGSQSVKSGSRFVITAATGSAADASGNPVNILDRTFNLTLQDNTQISGNFRLYYTQTSAGIFVHGINVSSSGAIDPANDKFRPNTANPPSKVIYLPDPAADGASISHPDPLDTAGTGAYSLTIGEGRTPVAVPVGTFRAKPLTQSETFSSFRLTGADFVPDIGVVKGNVDATLSDNTRIQGEIVLTNLRL